MTVTLTLNTPWSLPRGFLLAAHDSGLHSDAGGTPFRYAAWDYPDVIGRHYKLEQVDIPGGRSAYGLIVYADGTAASEWYRFDEGIERVMACTSDGRVKRLSQQEAKMNRDYVVDCLRSALQYKYGYRAPIAPQDDVPMQIPLTSAENALFVRMAGCYVLELPGAARDVLKRLRALPEGQLTADDITSLAMHLRRRRELPSKYEVWPETVSFLKVPEEWISSIVQRAVYSDEPNMDPIDMPARERY